MIIISLLLLFFTIGKFLCFFNINPDIARMTSFGHIALYATLGISLIIIFTLRLKQTFYNTIFGVTKNSIILVIIIIGTILIPLFVIIGLLFYFYNRKPTSGTYIFESFGSITYCLMSGLLLYMYISRLRKVMLKYLGYIILRKKSINMRWLLFNYL